MDVSRQKGYLNKNIDADDDAQQRKISGTGTGHRVWLEDDRKEVGEKRKESLFGRFDRLFKS